MSSTDADEPDSHEFSPLSEQSERCQETDINTESTDAGLDNEEAPAPDGEPEMDPTDSNESQ